MNKKVIILPVDVTKTLEIHGYKITEEIGAGGFAMVFQVWTEKYNQFFAAKVFDMRGIGMTHSVTSFSSEINSLKELHHPNVISIYDHFSDNSFLYIILDYCLNGCLADHITDGIPMPETTMKLICLDTLNALTYCHKNGIAHRDIKPANILIDKYCRAKLADFGLSQHVQENEYLLRFGGSRPFLSPEIIKRKRYDPMKADVWALGIVFILMATGKVPNLVQNNGDILETRVFDNINPNLVALIQPMLDPSPEKRPTMEQILQMDYLVQVGSSRSAISERRILKRKQRRVSQLPIFTQPNVNTLRVMGQRRRNCQTMNRSLTFFHLNLDDESKKLTSVLNIANQLPNT
ncbi:CBL-interacting serine/threonine-protein kinase 4 [Tritrichomonas foetus]|uniref:CBL-interacting serine/threonine-protein kinase 4 n=1 Tax=Tritrichomonas foetus TaxID=1144522 RepID=A0A1J4JHL3_9EUKA|nr:CBL-interacting serine/threonine-protein kinase 4 [Tritrichomonas foetus]|eukprot:OHS96756.1 CBL-interacting serine/threonine-protein kinase 4 [Tritrichomonas foetus]